MSAFDKVIGYERIKEELMQICDMIHNKKVYDEIGAKLPHGILLSGNPGLGKTLLAKSFIDESGLKAYTVRRNKASDNFIDEITATFEKAKKNEPSIVLLDDMDKFANEDASHRDAEEYIAVQTGIDDVKNNEVFVIATVNDRRKLPHSLIRSGRFDRKIEITCPKEDDARAIIEYYLSDKKVSDSVNMEDLSKMISYSSCAELETILNEAAIRAAYARKQYVEMDDLVEAVLKMEYDSPDNYSKSSLESIRKTALHEAGHLVVCEALVPGSIGMVSIRPVTRNKTAGFTHGCKEFIEDYHSILVSLAGNSAVSMYYAEDYDSGSRSDIEKAVDIISNGVKNDATRGFAMMGIETEYNNISETSHARLEAVIQAELERFSLKAREILIKNRIFLEKATQALMEKETLLYSDICEIKKGVDVVV